MFMISSYDSPGFGVKVSLTVFMSMSGHFLSVGIIARGGARGGDEMDKTQAYLGLVSEKDKETAKAIYMLLDGYTVNEATQILKIVELGLNDLVVLRTVE